MRAIHVRRAFDYVSTIWPDVVVGHLRQSVIDRAVREDPPEYLALRNKATGAAVALCPNYGSDAKAATG